MTHSEKFRLHLDAPIGYRIVYSELNKALLWIYMWLVVPMDCLKTKKNWVSFTWMSKHCRKYVTNLLSCLSQPFNVPQSSGGWLRWDCFHCFKFGKRPRSRSVSLSMAKLLWVATIIAKNALDTVQEDAITKKGSFGNNVKCVRTEQLVLHTHNAHTKLTISN